MNSHVHSLNTSPAKQKYSFGKEGRFRYDKPQYACPHPELTPTTCPPLTATVEAPLSATGSVLWE
jgi:hypothetical protein